MNPAMLKLPTPRTNAPMDFVVIGANDTDRLMVELHNNLCNKGMPVPNETERSIINGLIGVLEEASLNRLCPNVEEYNDEFLGAKPAKNGEDY